MYLACLRSVRMGRNSFYQSMHIIKNADIDVEWSLFRMVAFDVADPLCAFLPFEERYINIAPHTHRRL